MSTCSLIASTGYGATTVATLNVGGVAKSFSVATLVGDTTPDAFSFAPKASVALNAEVISDSITVSGIDAPAPISVTGGLYSINGGAYTGVAGVVSNGDTVMVQQISSPFNNTLTSATLTIGGVSTAFSAMTQVGPSFYVTPQVAAGAIGISYALKSDGTYGRGAIMVLVGLAMGPQRAVDPRHLSGISGVFALSGGVEYCLALRSDGYCLGVGRQFKWTTWGWHADVGRCRADTGMERGGQWVS